VHPLNLKLYATEGERAFATESDLPPRSCSSVSTPTPASNFSRWNIANGLSLDPVVTQSKIYELRARSYTGTSEDLEKIFLALLLKQDTGIERGVELAAAVDAKGVTV